MQAAMQALLLVAEHGGPTMFARIGVMRAHVPRNGRLRKIPKKVQEFGLHLSLTGPVLGQGNRAIIHQARATGISVRIDKTDPFRRICREARAIVFIDTVGCGPQCLVPWTMVYRVDERPDARRGRRHGWQLEPIG